MIRIVTGDINSGKTTKMYELYQRFGGDGFISIKRMNIQTVHSYEILRLSKGLSLVLALKESNNESKEPIACQIGPYQFFESAIEKVESIMKDLIDKNVSPLFLDEIGPLELMGKCFNDVFKIMIKSNLDLIISVRKSSLEEVMNVFGLKEVEIIEV
jgi:nucleoside-triphosphatase THEP1